MSEYKKLYNTDPVEFKVNSSLGEDNIKIVVPPKGYAIVSEKIANTVQIHCPTLEVSDATKEDYKEYRSERDKQVKSAAKLADDKKDADEKIAEEKAKISEKKLEARQKAEKEKLAADNKAKIALINNEKEESEKLSETIVLTVDKKEEKKKPEKKSGRKGKK